MKLNSSIFIALAFATQSALAVPGPATTVVVANANDQDSVALAERYSAQRNVPSSGVCLLDLPAEVDMGLDAFEARWMTPLMACLGARADQIEAVVLVRGVPLRVGIPVDGRTHRVSAAAAVSTWRTEMGNGRPMRGVAPGMEMRCGNQACLGPRFENPYREGVFTPGWQRFAAGVNWRPVLVTMLHGRSYEDAGRLLDSALAGEQAEAMAGTFLLMRGADPARSARDDELEPVAAALSGLGIDVEIVPFDAESTGHRLGAFVTGSARLGDVIEGNEFAPGALADNVTSYGALPVNFMTEGQQQVSIARWVAQGVAGVHGTTDEPLSHVFPSRQFLVDYAQGMTLAESYHRNMPFAYWRNLVLGDPMTAPYAARPRVDVDGLVEGELLRSGARLTVSAEPTGEDPVMSLALYVDGLLVERTDGDNLSLCLRAPAREVQVLVVAQTGGAYPAKGWMAYDVTGAGVDVACPSPPDAALVSDMGGLDAGPSGVVDASMDTRLTGPDQGRVSSDVGEPEMTSEDGDANGGCSAQGAPSQLLPLLGVLLIACRRR